MKTEKESCTYSKRQEIIVIQQQVSPGTVGIGKETIYQPNNSKAHQAIGYIIKFIRKYNFGIHIRGAYLMFF